MKIEVFSEFIGHTLCWKEKIPHMIEEVYEAFKATGIDNEKAVAASRAVAGRENLATKEDILILKTELKAEFKEELLKLENKLTLRFGGMLTVAVGMIVALQKIF